MTSTRTRAARSAKGSRDAHALQRGEHARAMRLPDRPGDRIVGAAGEVVAQRKEGAMLKAAGQLQPPASGGALRQSEQMADTPDRPGEARDEEDQDQSVSPAGQQRQEIEQGEGDEQSEDTGRRPQGRPDPLPGDDRSGDIDPPRERILGYRLGGILAFTRHPASGLHPALTGVPGSTERGPTTGRLNPWGAGACYFVAGKPFL
jgi:hypothetical protein